MYKYECECGKAYVTSDIFKGDIINGSETMKCLICGSKKFQLINNEKPRKWNFEIKGSEVMLWLGIFYCVYRFIITGDFDYVLIASFGVTYSYICKLSDKVEKLNKHLKNSKEV